MFAIPVVAISLAISPFIPEPFLIGPFKVGDLILCNPKDNFFVKQFKDAGVNVDDVQKKMNNMNGYIVEFRSRQADRKWNWTVWRASDKPKFLIEGRTSIEVKDTNGNDVEICFTEAKIVRNHIHPERGLKGEEPYIQSIAGFTLRFKRMSVPIKDGVLKGAVGIPEESCNIVKISYDINGLSSYEILK
jgi:hypothetical protein